MKESEVDFCICSVIKLELHYLDDGFLKLCCEFVLCKLNFRSSASDWFSFHN